MDRVLNFLRPRAQGEVPRKCLPDVAQHPASRGRHRDESTRLAVRDLERANVADLSRVVQTLKENNVEDQHIAEFIKELSILIGQQIEIELTSALRERDFAELNEMDEDTAHKEISKRYKEITGTSIEQKSDQLVDAFVCRFLTEYQR